MSEKRTCPYCGEEIMATAKKCKHCGEWLDEEMRPTTTSHPINEINTADSESQATKKGISFKDCLNIAIGKKNNTTEGRATKAEFWYTWAWFLIIALLIWVIFAIIIVAFTSITGTRISDNMLAIPFFACYIGITIPTIKAGIRRLHDTGKSGWYLLIGLIPYIGLIILYFLAQPSEQGKNDYGAQP